MVFLLYSLFAGYWFSTLRPYAVVLASEASLMPILGVLFLSKKTTAFLLHVGLVAILNVCRAPAGGDGYGENELN